MLEASKLWCRAMLPELSMTNRMSTAETAGGSPVVPSVVSVPSVGSPVGSMAVVALGSALELPEPPPVVVSSPEGPPVSVTPLSSQAATREEQGKGEG
ncbi:hypothetical protein [Nannocystis pusilla]|uniref:hypothetical protein n=1 Tax=Nannocystis pusilla TaxID=889268 RepID=UPI003B77F2FF